MWKGKLLSINITKAEGGEMITVDKVQAVPGKGLEGDRYYAINESLSENSEPETEITLIEIEAIEALQTEQGIQLSPKDARRNLVTRQVPLNHLVDKEFQVGEVILRGEELCEPCQHLAKMTQPDVLPGLIHRGGLRADILQGGTIHKGDIIEELKS
jgi:MOSC domain-containing protein YiiM